jgi:ADP-ribose pyrophosphatase YjhB (NUDIX family)
MTAKTRKPVAVSVTVAAAVLTVSADGSDEPELKVLQIRRDGSRGWSLPSAALTGGERLADAVRRCVAETGVAAVGPQQLSVIEEAAGSVLTVAYVDVVPADRVQSLSSAVRLVAADNPGRMAAGHGEVVATAVAAVRDRYAATPDPAGLLGRSFTLLELRHVHEAVAGAPLQRDTFRRVMDPQLVGTGRTLAGSRGRPAEMFRRR